MTMLRRAVRLPRGGASGRIFGGLWGPHGTVRLASTAAVLQEDLYDVVVVGGGMVGSALAALLASSKLTSALKVAIIDIKEPPMLDGSAGLPDVPLKRVSSLSPASAALFRKAGAWEAIAPPRSSPFDAMQVWDSGGSGCVRYEAEEVGAEALGWVVENDLMQGALVGRLRASENTDIMWPAAVRGVRLPGGSGAAAGAAAVPARVAGPGAAAAGQWAAVELEGGRTLHTRLLVGADGGRSRVREMVGLRTVGLQYGQRGVVATVRMAPGGAGHTTAWQRFLPTGPLALLPVRDGYSNIVWSTTPAEAKRLEALPSEDLAAEVNRALVGSHAPPPPSQLATIPLPFPGGGASPAFQEPPTVESVCTPAQSFPLSLSHTGKYVLPRLALIGDAAHTVHPLAGQGVNLGFADAAALAGVIRDGVATGRDVGSAELLEDYESQQQRANLVMMAGLHGIQRLFGARAPPFALARNFGLDVINRSGPIKRSIVRYAMLGEVPGVGEARA